MNDIDLYDMEILRALARVAREASQEEAARAVRGHLLAAHPARAPAPEPDAVPFADVQLPDSQCAAMIEEAELEGLDDATVARRHGVPPSLAARALQAYRERYEAWLTNPARQRALVALALAVVLVEGVPLTWR